LADDPNGFGSRRIGPQQGWEGPPDIIWKESNWRFVGAVTQRSAA